MTSNPALHRLGPSRPGTPVGAFIASSDPSTTAVYGAAGYDFVIIDGEHGALGVREILDHIRAARAVGVVPIVRVLENRPTLIQQTLDLGPAGVIIPRVGSAQEARRAVAAAQYQPGGRGMCPGVPATDFNLKGWARHAESTNANVLVIPLIETADGVANAAEIASVDGVDLLFFGLADLAQDLGIDWLEDSERLIEIWTKFAATVKDAGASPGAPGGFGFEGGEFLVGGMDLTVLRKAAEAELEALSTPEESPTPAWSR